MIRLLPIAALLMLPFPALAATGSQDSIVAGCLSSTNWSESACICIAEAALELSPEQQLFLAATLNEDRATVTAVTAQLSPADMMQAAMFMSTAGPACQ